MAFQKPRINVITPDIASASIYLRSVKKWGKSTLFRDVINAKYGDPKFGLLVELGKEHGTTVLDGVNTLHINNYDELIEFRDWLVSTKGTEHEVKIVGFDTVDELIPMFEKYTINENNKLYPQKPVRTIKAAFGGYTAGEKMSASFLKEYIDSFKEAGIQVWAIAHTKYKNIKDKANVDTEGYMQLTSNLTADYEAALGDTFDFVMTGVVDRDIDVETQIMGDKTKEIRHATTAVRKLYLRGTPEIDAGGRFAAGAVPEFIVFDKPNMAPDFIKIVEEGMAKSKIMNAKDEKAAVTAAKKTDEATAKEVAAQEAAKKDEYPAEINDPALALEFIKPIVNLCSKDTKLAIMEYAKAYCPNGSIVNSSVNNYREIYDIIKTMEPQVLNNV